MFLSFAGYSFCKPHSASYALVSFKSAYLKVYYPAEFMAAVISNGGGVSSYQGFVGGNFGGNSNVALVTGSGSV